MMMTPAVKFSMLLDSLGIPIHGVSGTDANARIDFKDEATPQQRATAATRAAAFDWSVKAPRTIDEIEVDVSLLTPAQRQGVLNKMIAEFLSNRPRLAEALGIRTDK